MVVLAVAFIIQETKHLAEVVLKYLAASITHSVSDKKEQKHEYVGFY